MQVKELLASELPPTVVQLQSLPWQETKAAGVYGWILNPRKKSYKEEECRLYVGSASKYMFGLAGRKSQHVQYKNYSDRKQRVPTRLRRFIKKNRLNTRGSKFITLMTVQIKSSRPEDVVRVRYLVTLAEAVFTVWLGALDTRDINDDLRKLCPWGTKNLGYLDCASHNPLEADITQPMGIDDKAKKRMERMC